MSVEAPVLTVQKKSSCFHPGQLAQLDRSRIPNHIAIIPDGNRRWAKRRLTSTQEGHYEGADTLMEIVKAAQEIKVKTLTLYSFSTENWMRPKEEVATLMGLFTNRLIYQREEMVQNGIKLETIGDLSRLPSFLNIAIQETKQATQACNKIQLVLALNYGARDELSRAFKAMVNDYDQKLLKKEDLNEYTIAQYLDTTPWKDPELLIRTGGEWRVSNFLLWQISYSEIYITSVLWPDFTPHHLLEAIVNYQGREQRGGA